MFKKTVSTLTLAKLWLFIPDRFTAMDRAAMQARIIELQRALGECSKLYSTQHTNAGQRSTTDAGLPSTTVDVGESMALGLKAETFIYRIMFVLQGW